MQGIKAPSRDCGRLCGKGTVPVSPSEGQVVTGSGSLGASQMQARNREVVCQADGGRLLRKVRQDLRRVWVEGR